MTELAPSERNEGLIHHHWGTEGVIDKYCDSRFGGLFSEEGEGNQNGLVACPLNHLTRNRFASVRLGGRTNLNCDVAVLNSDV